MTVAGELFPARDVRELREQQKDHMNGILPSPVSHVIIKIHVIYHQKKVDSVEFSRSTLLNKNDFQF